jgi:hypothetical protein
MLLMGFGSKESFEEPTSIMNLSHVADFLQGSNGIPHDGCLLRPIEYLLDGNRLVSPVSITHT